MMIEEPVTITIKLKKEFSYGKRIASLLREMAGRFEEGVIPTKHTLIDSTLHKKVGKIKIKIGDKK